MGSRRVLSVLVPFVLLPLSALSQCRIDPAGPQVEPSLRGLAQGSFDKLLAGDKASVDAAEQIFRLTKNAEVKQRIASILLYIGIRKPPYFEYLSRCARLAVDDPTPWPITYDKQGKRTKKMSPAFEAWARKHHQDPREAAEETMYLTVIPLRYLAASRDPRAYQLLVRALRSHNYTIAMTSGMGLARLGDPRGIDQIIKAARAAPTDERDIVAMGLVFFADDRAQAAADTLIGDKKWLALQRQQAKLKGTTDFFSY